MIQDVYEPLDEYVSTYRDKFKQVAEDTFNELAKEAGVDAEHNRKTCEQLYQFGKDADALDKKITWWKLLRDLLWIIIAVGLYFILFKMQEYPTWQIVIIGIVAFVTLVILFWKVRPRIKRMKKDHEDINAAKKKLEDDAWEQMQPLNALYDWDVFTRIMSRTIPRLEFDPFFTTQRLADLQNTYGWNDSFNKERSVVYSHSGLINGNPFVICRTKKMEMGTKTYHGELEIRWETVEQDIDGSYQTKKHSETLRASVDAPYPEYFEKTRLIYGNTAAPDLTFSRDKAEMKEGSLAYKWERRKLRKKSQDLTGSDYAMMTNEEFEVMFNTSDRNNNQQFALLFTPLAQENILKLLRDEEVGFGDDFTFVKNKMINTITPDHLQELDLDMHPDVFYDFDFDKARANFIETNAVYFRSIYFSLAPLLSVPLYQQIRPVEAIYGRDMKKHSSFWEHEALANFWGNDKFKHPECVTDCILKTEETFNQGDSSVIDVSAHGFRAVQRVTYVKKYGKDGNWHDVPVYWDEYLPVVGKGVMQISEDNQPEKADATNTDRLQRRVELLNLSDYQVYRRHIASKV